MRPEDKILQTFHKHKKIKLYYNQIKDESKQSDNTVSRTLRRLVEEKILEKQEEKSNTFYKIRDCELLAIKFSEYELKKFRKMNSEVYIPVSEFLKEIAEQLTIILFGSTVRKEEREGSDIDILIVIQNLGTEDIQKKYEQEIKKEINRIKKKIETRSNYPFSITYVNEEELRKTKDNLVNMAKISGIIIKNHQEYFKRWFEENEG